MLVTKRLLYRQHAIAAILNPPEEREKEGRRQEGGCTGGWVDRGMEKERLVSGIRRDGKRGQVRGRNGHQGNGKKGRGISPPLGRKISKLAP